MGDLSASRRPRDESFLRESSVWGGEAEPPSHGAVQGEAGSAFEEKIHDVVGLYVAPPENAVVFGLDEKSSIRVLDRT